jgi:hypothetical protein
MTVSFAGSTSTPLGAFDSHSPPALKHLPSATAVGFLENLPLDQQVFGDLHRWLSVEIFEGCKTLFRYHLSDEEYSKLHSDFIRKKKGVTEPSVL